MNTAMKVGKFESKGFGQAPSSLLVSDRKKNPSHYSVVLVSEGAMFQGGEMVFEAETTDAFGHKKLGGIGDERKTASEFAQAFPSGSMMQLPLDLIALDGKAQQYWAICPC